MLTPDLRPWFKKLTVIGLIINVVGTSFAPALSAAGQPHLALFAAAIATAGAGLAALGASRRTDRARTEMATELMRLTEPPNGAGQ